MSCTTTVSNLRNVYSGKVVSGPASCVNYRNFSAQETGNIKNKCEAANTSATDVISIFAAHGCDINTFQSKCVTTDAGMTISVYYNANVLSSQEINAGKEACDRGNGQWYQL